LVVVQGAQRISRATGFSGSVAPGVDGFAADVSVPSSPHAVSVAAAIKMAASGLARLLGNMGELDECEGNKSACLPARTIGKPRV